LAFLLAELTHSNQIGLPFRFSGDGLPALSGLLASGLMRISKHYATKLESLLPLPESEHYSEPGRMLFLRAISQVDHYEQTLRMILRRYEESSEAFKTLADEGFWDMTRAETVTLHSTRIRVFL
jgi:hypothetical protein